METNNATRIEAGNGEAIGKAQSLIEARPQVKISPDEGNGYLARLRAWEAEHGTTATQYEALRVLRQMVALLERPMCVKPTLYGAVGLAEEVVEHASGSGVRTVVHVHDLLVLLESLDAEVRDAYGPGDLCEGIALHGGAYFAATATWDEFAEQVVAVAEARGERELLTLGRWNEKS